MGTRHNIVFTYPENVKYISKGKKISQANFKGKCPMIYVHWDGYPSGALPILKEFLQSEGAMHRKNDIEYLSAYYVAWKIIHDLGYSNLKEIDDYRSIGIESQCNDWCDYTYVVIPLMEKIIVCDGSGKIIADFFYNEQLIEDIRYEEWFY